jgi:hypothetical protein
VGARPVKPVRVYVIVERDCPHCRRAFETSRHFRALLRRADVRVFALDDELDVHEVGALWVGLSEHERLLWATGKVVRGSPKTPSVIVDDGVMPKVRMPLAEAETEFQMYEQLAAMLTAYGHQFPPVVRERERREETETRRRGRR